MIRVKKLEYILHKLHRQNIVQDYMFSSSVYYQYIGNTNFSNAATKLQRSNNNQKPIYSYFSTHIIMQKYFTFTALQIIHMKTCPHIPQKTSC